MLVLRGNDEVIQSTVNNPGAEFTDRGFTRLVNRAEGDDNLATCIGQRPAHSAAPLSQTAGESLRDGPPAPRGRQPAAGQGSADRGQGGNTPRPLRASSHYRQTAIAHALVKSLFEDGRLDEFQLAAFAEAGKFDETNASIAALANVRSPSPRT